MPPRPEKKTVITLEVQSRDPSGGPWRTWINEGPEGEGTLHGARFDARLALDSGPHLDYRIVRITSRMTIETIPVAEAASEPAAV
jgi:hypothetical protein